MIKISLVRVTILLLVCFVLLTGVQEARAQSAGSVLLKAGLEALKSKSAEKRADGAQTLGDLGPKGATAVPALVAALKDSNVEVRNAAADALGKIGVPAAPELPLLIAALKDSSLFVCKASATNIKRIAEALAVQKKTLSVAVLEKSITDLEAALHAFAEVPKKEEMQDTLKETEPGISEAQFQLKEELKSRSPQAAATAPETSPQRHDLAEARRLIKQAEQEAAKIPEKELRVSALEDVAMAKARAGDSIQVMGLEAMQRRSSKQGTSRP